MEEAIARFNSWQCPKCKKFIPKPKEQDMFVSNVDSCKFCRAKLHFPIPKKSSQIQVDETSGLPLGEVLMNYLLKIEEQAKLEEIKKLSLKVVGLDNRYTLVNFTNMPYLFKWFKNFEKEDLSLSEVIIGFAAKGVKYYLDQRKLSNQN